MTDGCEWVVDAHGCDPVRLTDRATLDELFSAIIAELRLTPVASAIWHVFPAPGGITGLVPLAESHLTIHTFPEHGSVCINLFCCRPRADYAWAERLGESLGAEQVDVRRLDRRYAAADSVSAVDALATRHSPFGT
jgi:S-adenosylmethionine decarboxylase